MMRSLQENVDLMTVTGLVLFFLFGISVLVVWQPHPLIMIVSTFVGMAALHTALHRIMEHRQQCARQKALEETRAMLQDIVSNQLAVIALNAQLSHPEDKRMERINGSIAQITSSVESLSEESLEHWKGKYFPSREVA